MIGESLKTKREALGLDLKEIAATLRIRCDYLQALEEDSFEKLPAEVYIKGYIREYAVLLRIDPEPIIASYTKQQSTLIGQPQSAPPVKHSFSPLILSLVSGAIICCAIFIIFFTRRGLPVKENEIVRVSPPATAQPVQKPAEVFDQPSAPKEENSASEVRPKQYVLRVSATDITWLRIELGGGKSEEVLLQPGDSKEWTSQDGFRLKIGNAGGIKLMINGQDMGTLGKKGEVMRLRLPKEKSPEAALAGDR